MNIIDLRTGSRRSMTTRRMTDRCGSADQSDSPERLEINQWNYSAEPKPDRRAITRRTEDRRESDHRRQQPPVRSRREKESLLASLTPGERKLIEDIFLNNME